MSGSGDANMEGEPNATSGDPGSTATAAAAGAAGSSDDPAPSSVASTTASSTASPLVPGGLREAIAALRTEQVALATQRQAVARNLRNHTRRASRLKKRARQLTDVDLVEVLRMRAAATVPVPGVPHPAA